MYNLLYLTAGHGGDYKGRKCSDVKLDAITSDDGGKSYLFAGKVKKGKIVVIKINSSTFWEIQYLFSCRELNVLSISMNASGRAPGMAM